MKIVDIFPCRSKRANRNRYAGGAWSLAYGKLANESRHILWSFPEGKTEAVFGFIVRHYSQPSDYVIVVQNSVTGETWNIYLASYRI